MARAWDIIRYGQTELTVTGALGGTRTVTVTHSGGTTYPNAHVDTTTITLNISETSGGLGAPTGQWGLAVVEDGGEANQDYTVSGVVMAYVALGTGGSLPSSVNVTGLVKGGQYRLVLTTGDNADRAQRNVGVDTGGLSSQYHFDADGGSTRGGSAPNVSNRVVGAAGSRISWIARTPTSSNWRYGQSNQVALSLRQSIDVTSIKNLELKNSFSFAAQETSVSGLIFNNDGSKMYTFGFVTDSIHEYSLSVPFDIGSTVTYTGNSFSVSSEGATPMGATFNNDGSKMYVLLASTNSIHEYSLSVPFDIGSTITYTGNNFFLGNEESTPRGFAFNNDGSKMYSVGTVIKSIHEYSLSVPFDIGSTITYTGNNFFVGSKESSPTALGFNASGNRVFVAGFITDSIHEYSLSVPFDIGSTVTYTGNSFSYATEETGASGLFVTDDFSRVFVAGAVSDSAHEYRFSETTGIINPKQFKTALTSFSTDQAVAAGQGKFTRLTPNTTGDVTWSGIPVDTDFSQVIGGRGHFVQLGLNNTFGDSTTPAAEQASDYSIGTVQGVTTSQRAAFVFSSIGHSANTTTESTNRLRSTNTEVTASAALQLFETNAKVTSGVAPFRTNAYTTRQDLYKRRGPTNLVDAIPYLQAFVFDAYGNILANTAITTKVNRLFNGSTENTQTLTTDANGRVRWNYTLSATVPAFNRYIKIGSSRQANSHVAAGPDTTTGWSYFYSNFNSDDPVTYVGPYAGYPRNVVIEGRVYGSKEPSASDTNVFGVNSEGRIEDIWTGTLTSAQLDGNGVPTGAGTASQQLGAGSIKTKATSKVDPATLRVVDVGRHNLRDVAGRRINVTTDNWYRASGVFNDTLDAIHQPVTTGTDSQTKLENSLAYNSNPNSLDTIAPPTDPSSMNYFLALADTTTQRGNFALTVNGANPEAGFTTDSGNFVYKQQVVSFEALDSSIAAIITSETLQSDPTLTRRFTYKAFRVAADVDINPATGFNGVPTDSAPTYAVWVQPESGGAIEVLETGSMTPIGVEPTADWYFDLEIPLGYKMIKVFAVARVNGSPIIGGEKLPVQIGYEFDAIGSFVGFHFK